MCCDKLDFENALGYINKINDSWKRATVTVCFDSVTNNQYRNTYAIIFIRIPAQLVEIEKLYSVSPTQQNSRGGNLHT